MENENEISYAKSLLAKGYDIEIVVAEMVARDWTDRYTETYWYSTLES